MKFLHIVLISLLLVGCAPQVAVTTPTPVVSSLASTPASTAFLTPTSVPTSTSTPEPDPVLVGSGDIARCRTDSDEATANLLDNIPGTVFTTGDNVYPDGAPEEFANCYDPSWGRHKERTYPPPETMIITPRTPRGILSILVQEQASPARATTVTIWVPGMLLC